MQQYSLSAFRAFCIAAMSASLAISSCVDHGTARVAFAAPDETLDPGGPPPSPSLVSGRDGRVVLVTIDGVRPQEVFEGASPSFPPGAGAEPFAGPDRLMPNTHHLVATRGVALGADVPGCGLVHTRSGANVSLPGYLEIFTGRSTRCRNNNCVRVEQATVLDEAEAAGLAPVASIGSWDVLDRAVTRGARRSGTLAEIASPPLLVSEGRQRWPGLRPVASSALEELIALGEDAEPYPGIGQYRPDAFTAAIALEYFRTALPAVFHVGFGDADEWGHRNDYGGYLRAVFAADAFIGRLAAVLDGMGALGAKTTVIVTTDHGRNASFQHHGALHVESGRTFVLAFGGGIQPRGAVCSSRDVTLADIAPTMRVLLGLPPDTSLEAGRPIESIVTAPLPIAGASSRPLAHLGAAVQRP